MGGEGPDCMNDIQKTDPQLLVELAREAKDMLDNRAFTSAVATLKAQWYGEMMTDMTDDSKVPNLRAKLQALEAIPQMLRNIVASPQFAQRGSNVRR